jgi:hypothetical protein
LSKQDKRYCTSAPLGAATKRRGEDNDCVVLALAYWLGIDYDEAHDICAEAGRAPRRGTILAKLVQLLRRDYGYKIEELGISPKFITRESPTHKRWGWDGVEESVALYPTLAAFLRSHPVGRFLVATHEHAFVVDDGLVVDRNQTSMRGRVTLAYTIIS